MAGCGPTSHSSRPTNCVYPLKELTPAGVPIYDFHNPEKLPISFQARLPRERLRHRRRWIDEAMCPTASTSPPRTAATGSYPNPYGRHDAPAARRGLLIAPFRTNGVIEDVPGVGSITAIGGDRGEWFLMTMDGLLSLQPPPGLQRATSRWTKPMSARNRLAAFIWRDEKGRILLQLGGPSYRIMEMVGARHRSQANAEDRSHRRANRGRHEARRGQSRPRRRKNRTRLQSPNSRSLPRRPHRPDNRSAASLDRRRGNRAHSGNAVTPPAGSAWPSPTTARISPSPIRSTTPTRGKMAKATSPMPSSAGTRGPETRHSRTRSGAHARGSGRRQKHA